MSARYSKLLKIFLSVGLGMLFLMAVSGGAFAQDDDTSGEEDAAATTEEAAAEEAVVEVAEEEVDPATVTATLADVNAVQFNLDWTWILIAGFLVFLMQAGFAMLEGGMIRQTGVVNSMAENFMDACITGIVFFLVGYGIAYAGGDGEFFLMPEFALGGYTGVGEVVDGVVQDVSSDTTFIDFFFQFAFAGAAATIATGAMAERTDFRGKMLYSALLGAFIYPVVVFWTWGGGWLAAQGFLDFAGSTIVHQTGGVLALVGAMVVGPRVGRIWGKAPAPSNLMLASLGTFLLWFGWYGFNVGSTLAADSTNLLGLVAVNTTLAAATGAISAMFYAYFMKGGKWDLTLVLNGSLAGLVGITAGCAFMAPGSALLVGVIAGVLMVVAVDAVESAKIDDAVGAFAVHGACGMWGTLAIGLFGLGGLTDGATGLLVGGSADQLITQAVGVALVTVWAGVAGFIMFKAIDMLGLLRMPTAADEMGIDAYEHGASVWPDVLPMPEDGSAATADGAATAPATGD